MYRDQHESERSILVLGINGVLLGLDRQTGAQRWLARLGLGVVEIAIHRDRVYASVGNSVHCVAYATGQIIGQTKLPIEIGTRPSMLVDGEHLFVATGGEIACLDLDGRVLWHDKLKGRGYGAITLGFPGNVRQADHTT